MEEQAGRRGRPGHACHSQDRLTSSTLLAGHSPSPVQVERVHEVVEDFLQWRKTVVLDTRPREPDDHSRAQPRFIRGMYAAVIDAYSTRKAKPSRCVVALCSAASHDLRPILPP